MTLWTAVSNDRNNYITTVLNVNFFEDKRENNYLSNIHLT